MHKPKLVLGLSGGVDSAVALSLLQADYEVHSVFLDIGLIGAEDARRLAESCGSPFTVADIRSELEQHVCTRFADDYLTGRTPSPCAICNPTVKFPTLFVKADEIGAEFVATGHYARIKTQEGKTVLAKSESEKDQSYMLARLPAELLPRLKFPLGELNKAQVREKARGMGLFVAEKPDSMEICFVPGDDYGAWLESRGCAGAEGNFVDTEGNVLGRHKGIHRYTLGQGKGLGVSYRHRLFVSRIDVARNEVVLSDGSDLHTQTICAVQPNWLAPFRERVTAKFRHSKTEVPATLCITEQGVTVRTDTPVRAPTPGQLAVFYDGDIVVGSGWIAALPG
jgi:tRNA (5-methylaminomethyl-2-thiouridylate)-methyltransferase